MTRSIVIVAVAAGVALAGCGESKQDKAQAQVCSARADIKQQIDTLTGLTASTITLDAVRSSLQGIGDGVKQIASAQADLSGDRRDAVQQANAAFKSALDGIATTLLTSLSLSDAAGQLKTAASTLATSYQEALAPIDCT